MADERSVEEVREDIDALDAELVRLLSRRVELAREIGRLKGSTNKPFFTPERERQIYERLDQENDGPIPTERLIAIFREVVSAARAAEKPMAVGFWGPEGTFSHQAVIETFGRSVRLAPLDSISDVFREIERGEIDYGVAPIENSSAGVVPETLDMFPQTNVRIVAETFVKIEHHLVTRAERIEDVEVVYAGPQPAAQCRRWLRENLPKARVEPLSPTARAAERASSEPNAAAIANRLCVELVGIPILKSHIQDSPNNNTRFVVLGYNEPERSGYDKTSLMFSLRNRPGQLYSALGVFVRHGVNLLMIESRPAQRTSFEYIFYADCAGHREDPNLRLAIEELKQHALETTVLGSYPSADPNVKIVG